MADVPILLPPNASQLELDLEQAISAPCAQIAVERIETLWRPQQCPTELLPWLAWALSVDYWDPRWDEQTKRDVVAASIPIHRKKGTPYAVKYMLEVAGFPTTEIIEWWQKDPIFNGPAHTFCLRVLNGGGNRTVLSRDAYAEIERIVDLVKPVRSHYCFQAGGQFSRKIGVAGALRMTATRRQSAVAGRGVIRAGLAVGAVITQATEMIRLSFEGAVA